MKRKLFLAVAIVLLTTGFVYGQRRYIASDAGNHVGEYATVVGKVYQVYTSSKGTVFLDIGGKYPNNPFTAVIFSGEMKNFSNVKQYEGKTIEVTGKIREYRGSAEIILNDPEQIRIVN